MVARSLSSPSRTRREHHYCFSWTREWSGFPQRCTLPITKPSGRRRKVIRSQAINFSSFTKCRRHLQKKTSALSSRRETAGPQVLSFSLSFPSSLIPNPLTKQTDNESNPTFLSECDLLPPCSFFLPFCPTSLAVASAFYCGGN